MFFFFSFTGIYTIILLRLKNRAELQQEDEEYLEKKKYEEILTETDVAQLSRAQRRARARHIMKQQRRVVAPQHQQQPAAHGREGGGGGALAVLAQHQDDDDNHHPDDDDNSSHHPVLSRKERQRLAKAAEREERKVLEQERKEQQEWAQKQAQQRKLERLEAQARQQEQERLRQVQEKIAADKAKKEAWETFLVNQGSATKLLVNDWIQKCKMNRFISLDALVEEFAVSLETVRDRIQQLVKEQRVAGVFASENLFIFFDEKELQSLADAVQAHGCMDACEIAAWMNTHVAQHVAPSR